jgi:hypothetical protein
LSPGISGNTFSSPMTGLSRSGKTARSSTARCCQCRLRKAPEVRPATELHRRKTSSVRAMTCNLRRCRGGCPIPGMPLSPYPILGYPGTNRARITNPADDPDQFHAKREYFHTRCSGKAFYGLIIGIRTIFKEVLETFTGINQWPNDAGIVGGQGRGIAWTLPGDPPNYIPAKEIHVQTVPGLPIRRVGRINFMQKGGTFIHAVPEGHFAGQYRESG